MPTPRKFFVKLFEIRDTVHFTHIAQPDLSLATHEALGGVYETITPIIDGLVEGYSGIMGKQVKIISGGAAVDNPLDYIQQSYNYIASYSGIFTESWILSELDEINKILAITLYKLQFVK